MASGNNLKPHLNLTSQHGWVSLPIIGLLLAVSALSVSYQNDVLTAYKWRGQLNDVEEGLQIWTDFQTEFVTSPHFSSALESECMGFCDLSVEQNNGREKTWQKNATSTGSISSKQEIYYQWIRYQPIEYKPVKNELIENEAGENKVGENENVSLPTSYRLCATKNQQNYLCWWWREGKLISNGWVSITAS